MLRIDRQQLESLREAPRGVFVEEMLVHLAAFAPSRFKAAGPEPFRVAIRAGIAAAGKYGFTRRATVRLYLELMVMFGSRFDTDPQYPWFRLALKGRGGGSQQRRAELLGRRAAEYRHRVLGPGDVYSLSALRKVLKFAQQPPDLSTTDFFAVMLATIAAVYPEKAAHVGEEALTQIIYEGITVARDRGSPSIRGEALMGVLMLAFGHGCADDPLHPWIAEAMREGPGSWPERLERATSARIVRVLAASERRA